MSEQDKTVAQRWNEWRAKNPDKVREAKRSWELNNREKKLTSHRKWYASNREKANGWIREWQKNNREHVLIVQKEWRKQNPDKVKASMRKHDAKPHRKSIQRGDHKARQRRYHERHLERVRARRRAYQAKRRADPVQRTVDAIRRRMRQVVNGQSKGAFKLLGYSAADLRQHLQNQFQPGMTWENYGLYGEKWHIDHVRPVSSFKLPEELVECFALSNLQPLWANDNLAKSYRWHP